MLRVSSIYSHKYPCFTGVQTNDKDSNLTSEVKDRFKQIFPDKKELLEDEVKCLELFLEKEQAIIDKRDEEIANVTEGFWDFMTHSAEKERNKIREKKKLELDILYSLQKIFEQEQLSKIKLREEQLESAKKLNMSQSVILSLEQLCKQSKAKQEINKIRESKIGASGFSKIAGYAQEKLKLRTSFIDKIDEELSGAVLTSPIPNAILFYGPTGCGKTTFAKAFAEEAGCNFIQLKCYGRNRENQFIDEMYGKNTSDIFGNNIYSPGILEKAQKAFLEKNRRTIVLIDEFDRFFDENTSEKFIKTLKGLMEDCSDGNHVTLFLTTNDPQRIPYELRNSHRTGLIVNLDPPSKENMVAVIEHYLKDYKVGNLDYEKITDELYKYAPNELYSNSHLEGICDIAVNDNYLSNEPMSTQNFLDAIKKYNESSENIDTLRITKKYLDKYEQDKKVIGT